MKLQTKFRSPFYLKVTQTLSTKKTGFSIFQFLILYLLLLRIFYAYIGITSEGGKLFSPFLSKYANFPEWLCMAITGASKFLLQVLGYSVSQRTPTNITLAGGGGVNLAWACLGAGAMSLWAAFIVAHRATISFKLKWITGGLGLICFLNVLRVIMIVLSSHYHWTYIRHFDAHTSFNAVTYTCIVLLMYIFVRNYNRKKENKTETA